MVCQWRADTLRRDLLLCRNSDEVVRLQRLSTPQILLLGVFSSKGTVPFFFILYKINLCV